MYSNMLLPNDTKEQEVDTMVALLVTGPFALLCAILETDNLLPFTTISGVSLIQGKNHYD